MGKLTVTTETTNAESSAVENFEKIDGVPDNAQQVIRVYPTLNSGETLQQLVTARLYEDRHGYWDAVENCGYLWNADGKTVDWKIHTDAIRQVGGIIEWVKPAAVDVNPSGRAPTGWHFPN